MWPLVSARLPSPPSPELGWLRERCDQWRESGQPWDACLRSWAEEERLHDGQANRIDYVGRRRPAAA